MACVWHVMGRTVYFNQYQLLPDIFCKTGNYQEVFLFSFVE